MGSPGCILICLLVLFAVAEPELDDDEEVDYYNAQWFDYCDYGHASELDSVDAKYDGRPHRWNTRNYTGDPSGSCAKRVSLLVLTFSAIVCLLF